MTTVIKKVLASTLKELMDEKSLSKITINDLTQSCGVSRQTFYNNFRDIYDLVECIYLQDIEISVGKNVTYENWQDDLAAIFQYIADNRSFVLNIYRAFGKEYLEKFLNQEVERFLTNLIFQEIQVTGEEAQQVEFSISFYTYALVGIGLDWIEKQMLSTADELEPVHTIDNKAKSGIMKPCRSHKSSMRRLRNIFQRNEGTSA